MKIKRIDFEDGEEGATPSLITVEMALVEATAIARVFGKMTDKELEHLGLPHVEVYDVLTSDVFNRYWEDGVEGVKFDA